MRERVLLAGDMARDDAIADGIDAELHVAMRHYHPGLINKALRSGGDFHIVENLENGRVLGELALETKATLAIVTRDTSLTNGVVDDLRSINPDLKIVGPNRWYSRLEGDKYHARQKIDQIDPSLNPRFRKAVTAKQVDEAIGEFEYLSLEAAVKPINPAGGRGVRVMGKNLRNFDDAKRYAKQIIRLENQEGVLIEQALKGIEFNLNILTDGQMSIVPVVTVDYPYRDDGDIGPPTGGMGSFAFAPGELPPFMSEDDFDKAFNFSKKLIENAQAEYASEIGDGQRYNGWLYPNFIMTDEGLKVIEINVRPGDPEWMNLRQITDPNVDMVDVYSRVATGQLREEDIRFLGQASVAQYFVPASYARNQGDKPVEFNLDWEALNQHDVSVYFSSAEKQGDHYRTIGSSRPVAFTATGDKPWDARGKILDARSDGGPAELESRNEIGQKEYVNSRKDPRAT